MSASSRLKKALAWALVRSRGLRLLTSRLGSGQAILLAYHRVNDDADPFFPSLPRRLFVEQLDYLAESYRVGPLDEVLDWLARGADGPARVAITIDDGYGDTVDVVVPELKRRNLPATLFLSTAPLETGEPLWIDRLRWLVKHATVTSVELPGSGPNSLRLTTPAERQNSLGVLLHYLKSVSPEENGRVMDVLDSELRAEGPPLRLLTWGEVRRICAGPIKLGAHTHRHFMLSRLDDRQLETEVQTSVDLIEKRTGVRVTTFAYPNGEPEDYDSRAPSVLERAGLRCALTTSYGLALPSDDPYRLPRVYTSEAPGELFAARLLGSALQRSAGAPIS